MTVLKLVPPPPPPVLKLPRRKRKVRTTHVSIDFALREAWSDFIAKVNVADRIMRGPAVPLALRAELKAKLRAIKLAATQLSKLMSEAGL